jgi:predicted transcriptional regulator
VRIKDQPKRVSIKQYNKEIDEAMARIDKGEYTTHEELIKESESW